MFSGHGALLGGWHGWLMFGRGYVRFVDELCLALGGGGGRGFGVVYVWF